MLFNEELIKPPRRTKKNTSCQCKTNIAIKEYIGKFILNTFTIKLLLPLRATKMQAILIYSKKTCNNGG